MSLKSSSTNLPPNVVLKIHVFNVGKGLSVFLECGKGAFAAIDCCTRAGRGLKHSAPALVPVFQFLPKDASLSFLAFSHAHLDHFAGMGSLATRLAQDATFLTPPLNLDSLGDLFFRRDKRKTTLRRGNRSLQIDHLIKELNHRSPKETACYLGRPPERLWPDSDYWISFLGPTKDCAKKEVARLEDERERMKNGLSPGAKFSPNALNAVFGIHFGHPLDGGPGVLFPGDLCAGQWRDVKDYVEKVDPEGRLWFPAVIAPHHGAREDNPQHLWKWLSARAKARTPWCAISALGTEHHPAKKTLETVRKAGAIVACTGLRGECRKKRSVSSSEVAVAESDSSGSVRDPRLRSTDSDTARVHESPARSLGPNPVCHGDLTLALLDTGDVVLLENAAGITCEYDPVQPSQTRAGIPVGDLRKGHRTECPKTSPVTLSFGLPEGPRVFNGHVCQFSENPQPALKVWLDSEFDGIEVPADCEVESPGSKTDARLNWVRHRAKAYGGPSTGVLLPKGTDISRIID